MAKVKICGLMRMEDIDAVNLYKPEYAGFVFAPGRRQIVPENARCMVGRLERVILPVGVFVNEAAGNVACITRYCALGAVQLHGSEDNRYIEALRTMLPPGVLIFKAIRIRGASSFEMAEKSSCDLLVLDAYTHGQAGGTGQAFDWRLIDGLGRPYLLAGGLEAGNVAGAVEMLNPYGVDVSSGVETNGIKDKLKIRQFISLARGGKT